MKGLQYCGGIASALWGEYLQYCGGNIFSTVEGIQYIGGIPLVHDRPGFWKYSVNSFGHLGAVYGPRPI